MPCSIIKSLIRPLLLTALVVGTYSMAASADSLKIVSFNLYNRPWERKARLETASQLLAGLDADIIALQEVATGWILPGDPVQVFTDRLKLHSVRAWHEENLGVFRTGIAVLSKFPILSSEYHEFARHDFWDAKGFLSVRIATPHGTLQFITLHIASTTHEEVRLSEWQELAAFAGRLTAEGPVVIAGDFNTPPENPALAGFVHATGAAQIYTGWPKQAELRSWTPDYRDACADAAHPEAQLLDYLFILPASPTQEKKPGIPRLSFEGGNIVRSTFKPNPSDHCPIEARIRWNRHP